jgi:hypothetical protein
MWRHVGIVQTDVSEEHIASIFRVEEKRKNQGGRNQREHVAATACSQWFLARWFFLLTRRWWYVPPKRRFIQYLRVATSQKTAFFCTIRHYATCRKVAGSIRDVTRFFNWPNSSSRTMALASTQPLTEMSTRNLPGGKGRPACKANNLTAICEPTV